jgi:hypothetical protein
VTAPRGDIYHAHNGGNEEGAPHDPATDFVFVISGARPAQCPVTRRHRRTTAMPIR